MAAGLTGIATTIASTLLVGATFGAVEGFLTGAVAPVGPVKEIPGVWDEALSATSTRSTP